MGMNRWRTTLCVVIGLSIFLYTWLTLEITLRSRQKKTVAVQTEGCACSPALGTVAPVTSTTEPMTEQLVKNHLDYYSSRIFHSPDHLERENFTIVIMTYRRYQALKLLLNHYCYVPHLDRIVVVWNDVETAITQEELLRNVDCPASIVLSISEENKLTNRYIPRKEIRSDCVVMIDDDRKIEHDDILFGFRVWQQFRQRIVGFEHRMHVEEAGTYFYGPRPEKGLIPDKFGYSLMGSGSSFLHKAYLEMFHNPNVLPRKIVDYIDHVMNCEDLAMCVIVAKFLEDIQQPQCAALSVQSRGKLANLEGMTSAIYKGLSYRADHTNQRSLCLNKFAEMYNGILPLRYTHARIMYEAG